MANILTTTKNTWCPGCFNFSILAGVKNYLEKQINSKKVNPQDFGIVTGIGCHAKMFDYINLNGINSLHGRVPPTCLGMKIANPNLKVIGFSGDGDAYAEGFAHTFHAARHNQDFTYIVHNNQVFALTIGEPTPVTEKGFTDKTTPFGVESSPFNPIALMIEAGAPFVARIFADPKQVEETLEQAMNYKGFSFIEIIQPCIIFHNDSGYKEKFYYLNSKNHDSSNKEKALQKAREWDYNGIDDKTKIPLGIFYKK
jgi:2-oxoglutarate/2-oxoacid ferredoxin oxidoreductase subunit beta